MFRHVHPVVTAQELVSSYSGTRPPFDLVNKCLQVSFLGKESSTKTWAKSRQILYLVLSSNNTALRSGNNSQITRFRQSLDRVTRICSPVYNLPDVFGLFSSRNDKPKLVGYLEINIIRVDLDSKVAHKMCSLRLANVLDVKLITKPELRKELHSSNWAGGTHYLLENGTPTSNN